MSGKDLVVVIFPEADTVQVEDFRSRWDPLAGAVAAHITLVYPFAWRGPIDEVATGIARVAAAHDSFTINFNKVMTWEDEFLFLIAAEGGDEVSSLHRDLYSGVIPGLVAPDEFVPHVTVGRPGGGVNLAASRADAERLGLSLSGRATALSIYSRDARGRRVREVDIRLRDSR